MFWFKAIAVPLSFKFMIRKCSFSTKNCPGYKIYVVNKPYTCAEKTGKIEMVNLAFVYMYNAKPKAKI